MPKLNYDMSRCGCPDCDGMDTPTGASSQPDVSREPTPYAIHCPKHGKVYLSHHNYNRQMWQMDSLWRCPLCGRVAQWDDDNYDDAFESLEVKDEPQAKQATP